MHERSDFTGLAEGLVPAVYCRGMRLPVSDSLLRLEKRPVVELTLDLLLGCHELLASARCPCVRVTRTCLRHARCVGPADAGGGIGWSPPERRLTTILVGVAMAGTP